jgi:hypothetical protein
LDNDKHKMFEEEKREDWVSERLNIIFI